MRCSQDDTRYPFVVQCEQFKTATLMLQRLQALPNVEILFNHRGRSSVTQTRCTR